jgi:hypothetical protein
MDDTQDFKDHVWSAVLGSLATLHKLTTIFSSVAGGVDVADKMADKMDSVAKNITHDKMDTLRKPTLVAGGLATLGLPALALVAALQSNEAPVNPAVAHATQTQTYDSSAPTHQSDFKNKDGNIAGLIYNAPKP